MRVKLTAFLAMAALLVPGAVAAQEAVADGFIDEVAVGGPETDRIVDRPSDRAVDRSSDRITDRTRDRVRDRCTEVDFVSDVCCPDQTIDRVTDRCHHEINLRQLIWRLIEAQEWEKLFRLLHRLHIL